jgi:hypothetical protein
VCTSKSDGGLGLKNLELQNTLPLTEIRGQALHGHELQICGELPRESTLKRGECNTLE